MKPGTEAVLTLLRQQGRLGVTPQLALERVGTFRLAARVSELRADGHNIETTIIRTTTGKHPARYILREQPDLASQRGTRPVEAPPRQPDVSLAGARRGAISPLPGGG